jgi:hypothetical protein
VQQNAEKYSENMGPRIAQMTMREYGFSTDEDEKLVEG